MRNVGGTASESPNLFLRQIFVPPNCPKNATAMQKVQWVKDRNFYTCKGVMNIIDYSNRKEAIDCSDSNINDLADIAERVNRTSDIIGYSHARPGSTGLFTKEGFCSETNVVEIKRELQKTKGNIWNGIISCKTKDSAVDIKNAEEAKVFFEKNIEKLFKNSGLDFDNIEYAVAYHNNTEHSHLHYTFWEKEAKCIDKYGRIGYTYRGVMPYKNICAMRAGFERSTVDANLSKIRTDRQAVTDKVKNIVSHASGSYELVQLKILQLSYKLPRYGRLSYSSESMSEHKKTIDSITSYILKKTDVKSKWDILEKNLMDYQKGLDEIKSYSSKQSGQEKAKIEKNYMPYTQRVIDDIYRRIGNIVLRGAKEYIELGNKQDLLRYKQDKSASYNKRLKTARRKYRNKTHSRLTSKNCESESSELLEELIKRLEQERRKLQKGEESINE